MNKNVKRIFFVSILLYMLVGITSANATDQTLDVAIDDTTDTITAEQTTPTTNDNTIETTKNLEKTDKNLKTASKIVNATSRYKEARTAIREIVNNSEYDELIINLNPINYAVGSSGYDPGEYSRNIIMNGNGATFSGKYLYFNNNCNFTFNDATISHELHNYVNMTFNNMTIIGVIENKEEGILIINNSTLNRKFNSSGISFSIGEAHQIAVLLSLSNKECIDIFFAQKSHLCDKEVNNEN